MADNYLVYGAKSFGYAPIQESNKFGAPVFISGMKSFNSEVEQNSTAVYADDIVYATIDGAKKRTGEAELLYIPEAYASMALGYVKQTNGMLVDTGVKQNHCIFYVETVKDKDTGKTTEILHYFYNVTATEGEIESATVEDEVDVKTMTIQYNCSNSAIAVDANGNQIAYAKIMRTTENAAIFDKYKTEVLLPTTSA